MPTFEVKSPDGKTYEVNAPEGATQEQAIQYVQSQLSSGGIQQPTPAPQDLTWSQVPGEAISNIPSSAAQFGKSALSAVTHPVQTAGTIGSLGLGSLVSMLPDWLKPAGSQAMEQTAGNVNQFFKNRYGSEEALKKTIATDPVGTLADLSAVFTGSGTLATKVPGLAKAGEITSAAGRVVNPVNIAGQAIKLPLKGAGFAARQGIGNMLTGTGTESISQAARAGFRGGRAGEAFRENLRGNVPMTNVLEDAKANLQVMRNAKNAQYRSGMVDISKDQSVLNMNGVNNAINDAQKSIRYGTQVKDANAARYLQQVQSEIDNWNKLDPKTYHTPEGLDALKQKIGSIQESIPYNEANARRVVGNVYNSIKREINTQAPTYSKVMKDYSSASDQVKEIERTLSLKPNANVDTSMRKLQSLMRNNVNTNFGNRLDLAKQLEQAGGTELMPSLAGQSMTSWTPRGIQGALAGSTLGLAAYAHNPLLGLTLPFQSPRLMGEAAYYGGKAAAPVTKATRAISPYMLPAYLLGRTGENK